MSQLLVVVGAFAISSRERLLGSIQTESGRGIDALLTDEMLTCRHSRFPMHTETFAEAQ